MIEFILAAHDPDQEFYHSPWDGFVVTSIVIGALIVWAVWIAWHNFGPNAKKPEE